MCVLFLFFFRESAVISSRFFSASMVVCLYVEQTPSTRSVPTTPSVSVYPPVLVPSLCICQFIYLYAFLLFSLQRDTLEMVGEPVSGMARCPYDPRHANVALFAGTVSCNEESTASGGDQTQFTAPETQTSVPLCLPLQMIYSQTSRCVSCLVLIFLTLCYRSICIFPLYLISSFCSSPCISLLRWKSLYRHRDRLPGHRRRDLSQPRRQPRPPHGQTRLQMVQRYFWRQTYKWPSRARHLLQTIWKQIP